MKRTISGKIYDTDNAEQVYCSESDLPRTDFHYFCETLCRTPRGAWFMAGEGGPMTRYAMRSGGSSSYGSAIVSMADDDVRKYLRQQNTDDAETALRRYFSKARKV